MGGRGILIGGSRPVPTMAAMSDAPIEPRVVLMTHPEEGAAEFARRLVERRVVACVNLVGVRSVYRWRDAIEDDPEVLLVAKTTAARVAELERVLDEEHPYDVPECVAVAPAAVEAKYLAWLGAETSAAG